MSRVKQEQTGRAALLVLWFIVETKNIKKTKNFLCSYVSFDLTYIFSSSIKWKQIPKWKTATWNPFGSFVEERFTDFLAVSRVFLIHSSVLSFYFLLVGWTA